LLRFLNTEAKKAEELFEPIAKDQFSEALEFLAWTLVQKTSKESQVSLRCNLLYPVGSTHNCSYIFLYLHVCLFFFFFCTKRMLLDSGSDKKNLLGPPNNAQVLLSENKTALFERTFEKTFPERRRKFPETVNQMIENGEAFLRKNAIQKLRTFNDFKFWKAIRSYNAGKETKFDYTSMTPGQFLKLSQITLTRELDGLFNHVEGE
jgi:hypothetical protein